VLVTQVCQRPVRRTANHAVEMVLRLGVLDSDDLHKRPPVGAAFLPPAENNTRSR